MGWEDLVLMAYGFTVVSAAIACFVLLVWLWRKW